MQDRAEAILRATPLAPEQGSVIGRSREGRPLRALRLGSGAVRVSLIAGCHADEPVGPRMLRLLAGYLESLPPGDALLTGYEWWLVPHINPDGEERNRSWQHADARSYDLAEYLTRSLRELPGDDLEFGFPRDADDDAARPEARAVHAWWRAAGGPFSLHASLHGMGFAAGPWFLFEEAWRHRAQHLMERCAAGVEALGYRLHDVERRGEKGFTRFARGFCSRPDSRSMRRHFESLGDHETAALFRPSSMETIRSLGGDALTLVSEMPLFLTPGVGESLGPPDPVAEHWRDRIAAWRMTLSMGRPAAEVAAEAAESGLRPMPVRDQMILQWTFVVAGLEQLKRGFMT